MQLYNNAKDQVLDFLPLNSLPLNWRGSHPNIIPLHKAQICVRAKFAELYMLWSLTEVKMALQHLHHSTKIVSVSVSSAWVWSKMAPRSFTPLDIHIHFVFEPHITQHYTHRNHHTWSLVIKYNSTLQKICPQHMLILNIHTAHRIFIPTSLLRPVVPHFTCSCPSMKVCGVGSKTCFSLTINFYKPIWLLLHKTRNMKMCNMHYNLIISEISELIYIKMYMSTHSIFRHNSNVTHADCFTTIHKIKGVNLVPRYVCLKINFFGKHVFFRTFF